MCVELLALRVCMCMCMCVALFCCFRSRGIHNLTRRILCFRMNESCVSRGLRSGNEVTLESSILYINNRGQDDGHHGDSPFYVLDGVKESSIVRTTIVVQARMMEIMAILLFMFLME